MFRGWCSPRRSSAWGRGAGRWQSRPWSWGRADRPGWSSGSSVRSGSRWRRRSDCTSPVNTAEPATTPADVCNDSVQFHLRFYTVPTLLLTKKLQDFSRTFQDPTKKFPGHFRRLRMFKYKEKNDIYLQYSMPRSNAYGTPKVAKFVNIPHCI